MAVVLDGAQAATRGRCRAPSSAGNELRERWLNPPEWTRDEFLEFPGAIDGPWSRYIHDPDARGIGTVRWPRLVPRDADCAKKLEKRTLTNLYNERPTWLTNAHAKLDEPVLAAYGWDDDPTDEDLLARLLALNLERAEAASISTRRPAPAASRPDR